MPWGGHQSAQAEIGQPYLRKSVLRAGVLASAVAVGAAMLQGMAQAAQWNNIEQTLNGTSWTTENYVRTVTTFNGTIQLNIPTLPGDRLDMKLKTPAGKEFAWENEMWQLNQNYVIADEMKANTKFIIESRNSNSSSDRWWAGRLYY
jgi:hypothetical protein